MAVKLNIKRQFKIIGAMVLLFGVISFTASRQRSRPIDQMDITITPENSAHFIHKEDIREIVIHSTGTRVEQEIVENIDLKTIEKALENDKFVEYAQVYRDLKGNLIVKVRQCQPIARVLMRDSSFYIGSQGKILPLSKRFAARVPLISGRFDKHFFQTEERTAKDMKLVELLLNIEKDEFLSKQIAQLEIDAHGEIIMHMQMSKQYVSFGDVDDIDEKLGKIKVFYDEILRAKGYNHYSRVDVKFKNQIVCE